MAFQAVCVIMKKEFMKNYFFGLYLKLFVTAYV